MICLGVLSMLICLGWIEDIKLRGCYVKKLGSRSVFELEEKLMKKLQFEVDLNTTSYITYESSPLSSTYGPVLFHRC